MLAKVLLNPDEARSLTDRIKARSEELWHLLLKAYEGGAHTALGYESWGAYFEAEYGGGKSQAYRVLDAGRVVKAIEGHSPTGERVPNERVARELAPLVKEDAKTAGRVLDDLVNEHGDKLTGAHAKKAVQDVFEATVIREELPPKTRAVLEETDPSCSMPRNPAQTRHLRDIADKRGDERAAETAERVANGEFKSTFEAYPEVKDPARKREALEESLARSPLPSPELTEEQKAYFRFASDYNGLRKLDPEKIAATARTAYDARTSVEDIERIEGVLKVIKQALVRREYELRPGALRRMK